MGSFERRCPRRRPSWTTRCGSCAPFGSRLAWSLRSTRTSSRPLPSPACASRWAARSAANASARRSRACSLVNTQHTHTTHHTPHTHAHTHTCTRSHRAVGPHPELAFYYIHHLGLYDVVWALPPPPKGATQPTDHVLVPDYRERAVNNVRQMKRFLCHECPTMHDKVARRRLYLAAFLKVPSPVRPVRGLRHVCRVLCIVCRVSRVVSCVA